MDLMRLHEKAAAIIETKGLRQNRLAQMVGCNPSRITQLKTGEWTPRPPEMLALARAFGVPVEWLIDDEQDFPPPPAMTDEERLLLLWFRENRLKLADVVRKGEAATEEPAYWEAGSKVTLKNPNASVQKPSRNRKGSNKTDVPRR